MEDTNSFASGTTSTGELHVAWVKSSQMFSHPYERHGRSNDRFVCACKSINNCDILTRLGFAVVDCGRDSSVARTPATGSPPVHAAGSISALVGVLTLCSCIRLHETSAMLHQLNFKSSVPCCLLDLFIVCCLETALNNCSNALCCSHYEHCDERNRALYLLRSAKFRLPSCLTLAFRYRPLLSAGEHGAGSAATAATSGPGSDAAGGVVA